MARNKTVLVSDIHMGASRGYDWLKGGGRDALRAFLKELAGDDTLQELILVGDVLDNWVWPDLASEPPTFAQILGADDNKGIVTALRALCSNPDVKVTWVQGNHDMDAWGDLRSALDAKLPGIGYVEEGMMVGPVWVEHGSRHAMFTAPDSNHGVIGGLPLGYFITRVHESGSKKIGSIAVVGAVVNHAVKAFTAEHLPSVGPPATFAAMPQARASQVAESFVTEKLAGWVFEFVVKLAGKTFDTRVSVPGCGQLTLGDARDRYQDLFEDYVDTLGTTGALAALAAEVDEMGAAARTARDAHRGAKAVVFGHSHVFHCPPPPGWYVNDGCFLGDGSRHFIEAVPAMGGHLALTVWRWPTGAGHATEGTVLV